jgi:dTMP kinase
MCNIITPSLHSKITVISDRGIDGLVAYQGYGRGIDLDFIGGLTSKVTNGLSPDLTILLDISPEISKIRTATRPIKEIDRFDMESLSFLKRVRLGYLNNVKESERFKIVDGDLPILTIHQIIIEEVVKLCKLK